ncbi:hypothetical protein [Rhodococcus sp. JS3073]|uniref:hypothetical protein n=1 Tax=Rhodococcus sp. JS3073 TaxID=3002901 RepID=UPI00228640A7|nr:hypothetical protein [Rhodococcus sp. JS3073]WAM14916.1 hypothetical protein OYT95_37065 [Rhodococcus sp. JS3073]
MSAIAFDYFGLWPVDLGASGAQNWVAIAVVLIVALVANTVAGLVRTRATEADQRRREVEANRDEMGVLAELQSAFRRVAPLVALGSDPGGVFAGAAGELTRFLGADHSTLNRMTENAPR